MNFKHSPLFPKDSMISQIFAVQRTADMAHIAPHRRRRPRVCSPRGPTSDCWALPLQHPAVGRLAPGDWRFDHNNNNDDDDDDNNNNRKEEEKEEEYVCYIMLYSEGGG